MANVQDEPVSIDMGKIKERLLAMQAQLEHDIAVKEAQVSENGDMLVQERGGVSNHMADDANDVFEQEKELTLQLSAEHELSEVRTALARLEDGTYGICANCGKPISPARLEARPWATLCIECRQLEDRGRL